MWLQYSAANLKSRGRLEAHAAVFECEDWLRGSSTPQRIAAAFRCSCCQVQMCGRKLGCVGSSYRGCMPECVCVDGSACGWLLDVIACNDCTILL